MPGQGRASPKRAFLDVIHDVEQLPRLLRAIALGKREGAADPAFGE
jgi:hypothetical protein